jgi:signal peptidase
MAVCLLVGVWLASAPRMLGGSVSYVIADGVSMQPTLGTGDVVILREASEYHVGDVVAYESHLLERVVLHRIVRVNGDRFVVKGDGNHWVDQERPSGRELLGRRWFVIPGAGRFLGWLKRPWVAAIVAALVGFLAWGGSTRGHRGTEPEEIPGADG